MKKLLLVVLFLTACGPTAPDRGQFTPSELAEGWRCEDYVPNTFTGLGNCDYACPGLAGACYARAEAWCFTSPELLRFPHRQCWTTEALCVNARDVTSAAIQDKSLCGLVP